MAQRRRVMRVFDLGKEVIVAIETERREKALHLVRILDIVTCLALASDVGRVNCCVGILRGRCFDNQRGPGGIWAVGDASGYHVRKQFALAAGRRHAVEKRAHPFVLGLRAATDDHQHAAESRESGEPAMVSKLIHRNLAAYFLWPNPNTLTLSGPI